MSSPADGRVVSNTVGDALDSGTCIYEMLDKWQQR
jgi:hypothetical protein